MSSELNLNQNFTKHRPEAETVESGLIKGVDARLWKYSTKRGGLLLINTKILYFLVQHLTGAKFFQALDSLVKYSKLRVRI